MLIAPAQSLTRPFALRAPPTLGWSTRALQCPMAVARPPQESLARIAGGALLGVLAPLGAAVAAASSTFGSVSPTARFLFGLKQCVLKNAGITVLLTATAFVILGGLLFRVTSDMTLSQGTFKSYSLLNNVPGADATADDGPLARLVSNVLYMIGVGTFAVLIGIVSDNISSSVEGLRVSNERVLERRHTVLLNWGEHTRPILRQLEAARREGRLSGPVVVLSSRDKEEMDAEVADELNRMSPRAGLTVLTRHGSPVELHAVDKTAVAEARRVIVLKPEHEGGTSATGATALLHGAAAEEAAEEEAEGAAAALRQSTGLLVELQRGVQPKPSKRANVVVSSPPGYKAEFVEAGQFGAYAEVSPDDFVSRVIAQCAVQPGLSHVYEEILLQGKGNELYTEPLSKHARLVGTTFGEAARCFPRAIPIGLVRHAAGDTVTTLLSPPDSTLLTEADDLVLIAAQRKDTQPRRAPRRAPSAVADTVDGASMVVDAKPQKLLLIGLDDTMPDIVNQIDDVCAKGSKITLLAPEPPKVAFSLKHSAFKHVRGDPTSAADLRGVDVSSFDAVVCLQQGGGSDADDSRLLVALLSLQQAAAKEVAAMAAASDADVAHVAGETADGLPPGRMRLPRVVGEVHSPSMLELVASRWPGGQADFVLPTDFAAGILVQFALQPQLKSVYSELLAPLGREIILSPAAHYAGADETLSFAALGERARARGEVAIGFHRAGEPRPVLNPPKDLRLKLGPEDRLVIIGDGF